MKKYIVILRISIVALLIHVLPLQAQQYHFKQLCLEDGIPSVVNCVYSDEYGMIWVGTQTGLIRFNGDKLRMYKSEKEASRSLPSPVVRDIVEDEQRNIWMLTNKGVARYRRVSDDFERTVTRNDMSDAVYSACLVDGGVLFGSNNILYFYSYKSSTLSVKQNLPQGFTISGMSLWDDHTVLCYSRFNGMQMVDLNTGELSAPPFECGKAIKTLLVDSQKRIWVAPFNKGLRCYDKSGRLLASYTVESSELSSDIVLCLAERDGKLWIGTDGGGINILSPESGEISVITHTQGLKKFSLPSNSILCLHTDAYNNMWAGSVYGGLICIREIFAKTYAETTLGNSDGLTGNVVQCLYQESDDCIWIGTDGGGVNRFNPQTGKFTEYSATLNDKVTSVCPYQSGKQLISVYSKGIYVFDPATDKKYPLSMGSNGNEPFGSRFCSQGRQLNLYKNTPHGVLFMGDNISRLDLDSREVTQVDNPKGVPFLSSPSVIAHEGDSIYLSGPKHILLYDNRHNKLSNLLSAGNDTVFNSVSRDEYGNFWVGSNLGLMRYDMASKKLKTYSATENSEIALVLCDRKGNVWIGANNRLFAFRMDEDRMVRLDESDGVSLNEYLPKAFLLGRDGDVYLGGVMGLLHIDDRITLEKSEMPKLRLAEVNVDHKRVNLDLDRDDVSISVSWNSRISMSVASQEEDIFRQKQFRYRISGFNRQYIESNSSELDINSLPPGTYHIKASCISKYGNWTPDVHLLRLTVLPPWYRSWWFLLICAILVAGMISYGIYHTLRRKDEKLKWAMREHEQQVYEEKVRFLINISHELRTPLTLIYAPLNRMLKKLSPDDGQYQLLNNVYRQTRRMKDLINMVLDVRRMEVGEGKLSVKPHPFNEWVEQVVSDFEGEGQAMKVDIRCMPDPEIGMVNFDKGKCEIVLNNLLINALKHSPEQTAITVTTRLLPAEGKVRIAVTDEGCGLKQVDVSKLFVRFYQGAGETQGSGIGLSYSKMLVELHGGTIGAFDNSDSDEHPAAQGATFFFTLPLNLKAEEQTCTPKAYINELIGEDETYGADSDGDFDTTPYTVLVVGYKIYNSITT